VFKAIQILFIALLALFNFSVQAQNSWKDFSNETEKNFYIDTVNITESGNLKNFYVKRPDYFDNTRYSLYKLSIDCKEKKVALLEDKTFSDFNLTNLLKHSVRNPVNFVDISPGKVSQIYYDNFCLADGQPNNAKARLQAKNQNVSDKTEGASGLTASSRVVGSSPATKEVSATTPEQYPYKAIFACEDSGMFILVSKCFGGRQAETMMSVRNGTEYKQYQSVGVKRAFTEFDTRQGIIPLRKVFGIEAQNADYGRLTITIIEVATNKELYKKTVGHYEKINVTHEFKNDPKKSPAPVDKEPTQSANAKSSSTKEVNPTAYIKALNSSFGPSGWAECIKGSVTVMAVSIKYNQTLSADVQKVTGVVEDTLGAMRKQMIIDGVSQSTLDNLIRSQPSLASGDQALKVVGGCYQKMQRVLNGMK
jgi:hypothetical protein